MTTARHIAILAGMLSPVLGMELSIECARGALCAVDDETPPLVALTAAIHHRRQHPEVYGATWATVTDAQAAAMTALVAPRREG